MNVGVPFILVASNLLATAENLIITVHGFALRDLFHLMRKLSELSTSFKTLGGVCCF